jgi:hypothetical protein
VAQQIFAIGSGIAGGAAGFFLAKKFVGIKDVDTAPLAIATLISIGFTFGAAVWLGQTARSQYGA